MIEAPTAEEATDPNVILDLICASLKGTRASPQTLSALFLRTGLSLAVQNKCESVTWGQLKRSIFRETNETYDKLVKLTEEGRPGA